MMSSTNTTYLPTRNISDVLQKYYIDKAQERETLMCPKCLDRMEPVMCDTDDRGYQKVWWLCKNIREMKCDFPVDLPAEIYWVTRTPKDIKEGYTPRPDIKRLASQYHHLYPSIFPPDELHSCNESRPPSTSGSSNGRQSSRSGRSSVASYTIPSATATATFKEFELRSTESSIVGLATTPQAAPAEVRVESPTSGNSVDTSLSGSSALSYSISAPSRTDSCLGDIEDADTAEPESETHQSRFLKRTIKVPISRRKQSSEPSSACIKITKRNTTRCLPIQEQVQRVYSMLKQMNINGHLLQDSELTPLVRKFIAFEEQREANKIKKPSDLEYDTFSKDLVANIDYSTAKTKVIGNSLTRLNAIIAMRNSKDAGDILNAVGAEPSRHRPKTSEEEDEQQRSVLELRIQDIVKLLDAQHKEKRSMMKAIRDSVASSSENSLTEVSMDGMEIPIKKKKMIPIEDESIKRRKAEAERKAFIKEDITMRKIIHDKFRKKLEESKQRKAMRKAMAEQSQQQSSTQHWSDDSGWEQTSMWDDSMPSTSSTVRPLHMSYSSPILGHHSRFEGMHLDVPTADNEFGQNFTSTERFEADELDQQGHQMDMTHGGFNYNQPMDQQQHDIITHSFYNPIDELDFEEF